MVGDDRADGESASACVEQAERTCDCLAMFEYERGILQQAAHRGRLGVLVPFRGRLQRPDRLYQNDIHHQQLSGHAAMDGKQCVDALIRRRIIVEPMAQEDVGVDADRRPLDFRPVRFGACLTRKCFDTALSICSVVSGAASGDLSNPRMRRASGWTCRAAIVLSTSAARTVVG